MEPLGKVLLNPWELPAGHAGGSSFPVWWAVTLAAVGFGNSVLVSFLFL